MNEKLCDGAVTDKTFDFHTVNGWEGQFDAVVRLEDNLYMAPNKRSNVLKNDVVKKTVHNELFTKVNTIDTGGFVLKTK